ncbi:alanine/glycine:cation symporter family protein [Sediminitomix flava]|uniref:AGCS family alanine or glycine:cation symporter n=1 Tax=Sediminitomix flava TaxID=379075 RepID=A0A315Z708_SEDFL|nr:alanine/glycine:cation symporter family protein [Sediminitomix flava]PWJ40002.1 AGCS family alanine or glycine:cation symporter [Sediminitomix flava]
MLELFESFVNESNNILWSYVLIILLIGAGLFFTIKSGFVQFVNIKEMFSLLAQGATSKRGGVSSFQAFCISTASRVGTGNLAGVALAIVAGGPGAVFWMWLIALIGSASAFVESTLAQIYKEKEPTKHSFVGGPAYYIEKALGSRNLGIVFSILITICFGFIFNAVQSNTITFAFQEAYGIDRIQLGLALTFLTAIIIFGGVKRIAKVSETLVPIMAVAYILVAIYVLISNIGQVPSIIALIVNNAFGLEQVAGGAVGAALMQGIKRGLFSNEAGMGSAPNAAATANVTHPVKQGFIQTLGVFTDTLLICTATAFLILISGEYTVKGVDGIQLTQAAMKSQVGDWGTPFIAVCILLFAFSSIVGNYYYGESNIKFISSNRVYLIMYRVFVLIMVMFGAYTSIGLVWNLADLFMGLMALINIYAILRLSPIAFAALKDYMAQKKEGKNPVFLAKNIGLDKGVECWKEEIKA